MATETINIDSIEGYEQEQVEKVKSLLENSTALNNETMTVLEIGESSGWNSGSGANVYDVRDIIDDPIGTLIGVSGFDATFEFHDTGVIFLELGYSHHDGSSSSKFIFAPTEFEDYSLRGHHIQTSDEAWSIEQDGVLYVVAANPDVEDNYRFYKFTGDDEEIFFNNLYDPDENKEYLLDAPTIECWTDDSGHIDSAMLFAALSELVALVEGESDVEGFSEALGRIE